MGRGGEVLEETQIRQKEQGHRSGDVAVKAVVFVVTWKILSLGSCPDYKQDEYGRYPTVHCAVAHFTSTPMSKEFNSKEEADKFVKDSGWEKGDIPYSLGSVFDFEIKEKQP